MANPSPFKGLRNGPGVFAFTQYAVLNRLAVPKPPFFMRFCADKRSVGQANKYRTTPMAPHCFILQRIESYDELVSTKIKSIAFILFLPSFPCPYFAERRAGFARAEANPAFVRSRMSRRSNRARQ